MEFTVYPIKVPTPAPCQHSLWVLSMLTWNCEHLCHLSSPNLPQEGKTALREHPLFASLVLLLQFQFILIKHISIVTTQKRQLRKYPCSSEYEVVRWQWPWSPEGLPSLNLQKCPSEKLVCTITVEPFSMGTTSPINASDRCKDGQRTKYCEREPPLIQGGDKQFLNLCRTDLGQHCSNTH